MDSDLAKMMHIEKIKNDNHLLDHLHIHHKSLSAKIYPNLGGSLQELVVNDIIIIDGISDDDAGLEDYKATYKSSVLFPFPNRIKDGAYEFKGANYRFPVNEPAVNNAIHGLVYNKEFEVSATRSDQENASVALMYRSDGNEKGFPFPFELILTYTIDSSGNLSLQFDIKNTGENVFPYGLGWHPYFLADDLDHSRLSFPSKEFYVCDERSLPVKTTDSPLPENFEMASKKFDDAYSLHAGECTFESDAYALTLAFHGPDESYLQVYTPPHGKSIALEPMTCIANSFNSKLGLRELLPGTSASWKIEMALTIKS